MSHLIEMKNILDVVNHNSSSKTCLKYRRSHSVGFPISVDRVFWNHVRANIETENIMTVVKNENE